MQQKAMPSHKLLQATIASISFSTPADLENAKHVNWLATGGKIPFEDVRSVIADIDKKLSEVSDNGGDTYVDRIYAELASARAGAQAQLDVYKQMLEDTRSVVTAELANAALQHVGAGRTKRTNGAGSQVF